MFDHIVCPNVWLLAGSDTDKQVHLRERLVEVGLRPTWQRMRIGMWAFTPPSKHFTPEQLATAMKAAPTEAGIHHRPIALATIYNTLNAFAEAGLLKVMALDTGERIFDTNTTDHAHIHLTDHPQDTPTIIDIPASMVDVTFKGDLPEGYELSDMSVVMRVKPKGG